MKLKIYGSVATLGVLTMVTNVSANTVATKVNGNNVLDFNVESKKTTETSTTTQTSRRKLILYLDRSASFANPTGQNYVNTLAEKLIDSMGPNDEMAIVGSENTDDMLIPNTVKNFIRMTSDKSALKAALKGSGDPITSLSNIVGRNVTDTELSNKSLVDIFAPGSSAKDITVVSLLDDTAISVDSSSTLAGFRNFKNAGGQVLAYVPNVINSVKTMNYLSSMGVTGEYIDYNNSDANSVAEKLVDSVTKKTVKETKVEKEVEDSTVKINIGGKNFKVKSAKLTKPDGSVENLTGETIDKTITNAKKGHYKVEYSFEGTINEMEDITGVVTVDGKEASKKIDTRKPDEEIVTKRTEKIPYKIKKVEDETLLEGVEKVVVKGVEGEKEITSRSSNGSEPKISEKIIKEPIDEVIHVGILGSKEEKETIETPYDTRYEDDNNSLEGTCKTKQEGVRGSKEFTRVWKTIKGVKKGEPKVTERELRAPVDEIIQIGTLGYRFERLASIVDSNYMFDYHDGTRYGKVTGTTLGYHGLTETTKKYKTIKGIVTGEPEVSTKTLIEKLDTDKKLGTHGKNVYTETMIESKSVTYVNDSTLEEGKEITVTSGQDGLKERVSVWETYKGYRRGDAKVTENVIKEKFDMVIRRGTKKKEVVQPKKEVVGPKVNEINKGVGNGLVSEIKPIVAPKVEASKSVIKEEVKSVVTKPMFAFDSFFKEISETSDLISRLVTRNVNEEKRVSDMVESDKKVTTSNELLDLIKLFVGK